MLTFSQADRRNTKVTCSASTYILPPKQFDCGSQLIFELALFTAEPPNLYHFQPKYKVYHKNDSSKDGIIDQ